jgi:hypothetical protein
MLGFYSGRELVNDDDWDETDVMRVGRKLGRTLYLSKKGEPEYPGKVIGIVDTRGLAEEITERWNEHLYHSDKTLNLVFYVLRECGLNFEKAQDVVLALQHVGILFREKEVH